MTFDIVSPEPESLLQSARSFGYSIETAIADLIDNSISAEATIIDVCYGVEDYNTFVRIEDNGKGMDEGELLNALRFGSTNPLYSRSERDLGRFGLGLKTASFSQCRRLTVKSRKTVGESLVKCWDLDLVASQKKWLLLRDYSDEKSRQNAGTFTKKGSGTIVLLEKLDRLIEVSNHIVNKDHFYRKFENVKSHLGLIFHRFIEEGEIRIFVQNDEIIPISPFHISNKVPSTELQEEQLSIHSHPIVIQPYILPHESKLTEDERKRLQLTKGLTDHQGIYLYRNKRLISTGGWLDLGFKKKENQRLCRIAIDIPNTLDTEWQIDVRKASAKVPDVIRKRVRSVCSASIEKAVRVYTFRGVYIRRKIDGVHTTYLWVAQQKHGVKKYSINYEHPLLTLLSNKLGADFKILKNYMMLLAEALPVNMIINDFADPETIIETPLSHDIKAIEEIYMQVLQSLTAAGVTVEQAAEELNNMEVFKKIKFRS